jgi:hypothetical protein
VAEPKTRPTDADVGQFLAAVPDERRRADAMAVDALMRAVTGEQPVVWGTSMVGYGSIERPGRGGRVSWPVIAFAPRRTELVLYLSTEIEPERFDALGPHRRGVGCLYLKRLQDVDQDVLRGLVERSVELTGR